MHIHVMIIIYSDRVNQLIILKFRLCCCPHGRCKNPGHEHQDATLWWHRRGSTTTLWTVHTSSKRRCSRSDAHTLPKELSHVESLVFTVFCRICVADLLDSAGRKWYANVLPQPSPTPSGKLSIPDVPHAPEKVLYVCKDSSMLFWYHCYLLQTYFFLMIFYFLLLRNKDVILLYILWNSYDHGIYNMLLLPHS